MTISSLSPTLTIRYEPLELLGQGAFATVLKARDRRNGRLVAIKHFQTPGGVRRKFFQELQVIMQLHHPHIVRCLDLQSADDSASALILEFADGGSLRQCQQPGTGWPLPSVLGVGIQVARGLVYAHRHGIVHRDLKPENVLCCSSADTTLYKIADFGIAKFLGTEEKAYTSMGSPAYMAPEQFYDAYDFKADIYALGVMLYELLHGHVPYIGSPEEIFKGHMNGPLPIADDTPLEVAHLLRVMLAKQPAERLDAAGLLLMLETLGRSQGCLVPEIAEAEGVVADLAAVPHQARSGASVFSEMFGGDDGFAVPAAPASPADSRGGAWPPAATANATDSRTSRAADIFSEGFGSAAPVSMDAMLGRSTGLSSTPVRCGFLQITRQWSRAVDTKSRGLANVDEGFELLVVAETSVYELTTRAGKGRELYRSRPERLGIPGCGTLPVFEGQELSMLHPGQVDVPKWSLEAAVQQVCIAPGGEAIAAVVDTTVYYHNQDGGLRWSGQLETPAAEVCISFEMSGELMVLAYDSDDHGVYFYDRDGHEVARYWLPGRIVAATRSRFATGAWVIITTADGPQVLRVVLSGLMAAPQSIEQPLRRLIGARGWLCGVDDTGRLHVLDPITGAMAPVPVPGEVLAYEHGLEEEHLYVLARQGDILRYLSAFVVEPVET